MSDTDKPTEIDIARRVTTYFTMLDAEVVVGDDDRRIAFGYELNRLCGDNCERMTCPDPTPDRPRPDFTGNRVAALWQAYWCLDEAMSYAAWSSPAYWGINPTHVFIEQQLRHLVFELLGTKH